jgi:tetratricopeptide (TPR) repeat protein
VAKVYVSSTRLDLKPELAAVMSWLVQARHQPAHSYVADTHTVREGCLNDVRDSDAYVLILGHRYGHVPTEANPERLSITELEYGAARDAGLPIVVLQSRGIRDVAVTDVGKPEYAKVVAFSERVNRNHKAFQFLGEAELIAGLSTGLQKALRGDPLADPAVQRVIARLSTQATVKDERIEILERENARLKQELAAAVAHTLHAAGEPGATALERAAATALEAGNTKPAEALLKRNEEAADLSARQSPDEATARIERRRAAQFARERGALAMQTDVAAALAAYQQATEYEPDDLWSWFFLGDLYIANGNVREAEAAYRAALAYAERRAAQPTQMTMRSAIFR